MSKELEQALIAIVETACEIAGSNRRPTTSSPPWPTTRDWAWMKLADAVLVDRRVIEAVDLAWNLLRIDEGLRTFLRDPSGRSAPLAPAGDETHFRTTLTRQLIVEYFVRDQSGFLREVATDCVESISAAYATGRVRALVRTWLVDVWLDGRSFRVGPWCIRELSEDERKLIANVAADNTYMFPPDFQPIDIRHAGAIAERTLEYGLKDGHTALNLADIQPSIEIMRLVSARRVRAVYRQIESNGFPFGGGMASTWTTAHHGGDQEPTDFDGSDLAALEVRARNLSTPARLALRRFGLAVGRTDAADRLIDYWVGLEALFLADADGELTFRAGLRIAAYLGKTAEQRLSIFESLKKSYRLRSKIVHGSLKGTDADMTSVDEAASVTGSFLRQALLQILGTDSAFVPAEIERELLRRSAQPDPPDKT